MARGRIVADGPPTEIKAMVGVRTIRATVPQRRPTRRWPTLPGVTGVERHGEGVVLACADSDAAIRALLERFTDAREIEISGAGLEEAFLQLTGDDDRGSSSMSAATYTRYELVRTFRNRRFFIFSLVFPLVLYYLIAGPNRDEDDIGNSGHLGAALLTWSGSPRTAR